MLVYQPRTQALHCFYRDQWQLINLIASDLYKNNGAPGYEAACLCQRIVIGLPIGFIFPGGKLGRK